MYMCSAGIRQHCMYSICTRYTHINTKYIHRSALSVEIHANIQTYIPAAGSPEELAMVIELCSDRRDIHAYIHTYMQLGHQRSWLWLSSSAVIGGTYMHTYIHTYMQLGHQRSWLWLSSSAAIGGTISEFAFRMAGMCVCMHVYILCVAPACLYLYMHTGNVTQAQAG
jgi:hypothetical protein